MQRKPYSEPSRVVAENGEVLIEGPDGLSLSMTPVAAKETAHRLLGASDIAKRQERAVAQKEARE